MTDNVEAIQALDRTNQFQMIVGYGAASIGLCLFIFLVIRNARKPVPKIFVLLAALLCLAGLIFASSLTYY